MPHVSLRVSEQEKQWMESYARLHGINLSDAIKKAFFEKMEDEYDLECVREYEMNPDEKVYTHVEVQNMLRID